MYLRFIDLLELCVIKEGNSAGIFSAKYLF